jgi:hypothetical protein
MPQTGAQARADMANRTLNPTRNVTAAGSGGGGQIATFVLRFAGRDFNPEDVYDALVTKYGAGKVSSDRDVQAQGQYHLTIIP